MDHKQTTSKTQETGSVCEVTLQLAENLIQEVGLIGIATEIEDDRKVLAQMRFQLALLYLYIADKIISTAYITFTLSLNTYPKTMPY